jgi:hypothetical protein
MAKMSSFYDDFAYQGVDRSKWNNPTIGTSGVITIPANSGLSIYPSGTGSYTSITSANTYDMTNSYCRIQLGGQYGVNLTNTNAEASMTLQRDADSYRSLMLVINVGGVWKLKAEMYDASNTPYSLSGTVSTLWYPSRMKYWRQIRVTKSSTVERHYFQYSSDGATWTTLAFQDLTSFPMTAMRVKLTAGDGTGTGQYFTVRRLNTMKDIDRGSGYVSDDFDSYAIQTLPTYSTTPPTQFGPWISKTATASIIQDPDDSALGQHNLSLAGTTGATATLLAQTRTTLKDVDFIAKVRIQSTSTTPSGRLVWRVSSSEASYWYLKFTATTTTLGYFFSSADHDVTSWTTNMGTTKFWTYRVIHVGSEIMVYIDTGYGTAGYGRPTIELTPRTAANANNSSAGSIGFKSTSQTTYVKDVTVSNGVTPTTPVTFTPAEPTQVSPWTGSRTAAASNLEYMYLMDDFGNTLNILPSYGDIVLKNFDSGTPIARQIVKQRPLGNGATSYTRFHGEKPVALNLSVYKTVYQEAQYYSDLIQRWARPGWKSKLVYKPRGDGERYINIEGNTLGRSVVTALSNQKIDLDLAFLAVDGGDYETVEQSLTLGADTVGIATSYGSLQTEIVVRIYGPCTNPIIYGQTIEAYYPGTRARLGLGSVDRPLVLDATEFVDLDTKTREVRYMGFTDDAASYRPYLTTRDWFWLEPLRNALYYTSDDVSGTARVTWRDKF